MRTFYNHYHALHQGRMEMFRGKLVPCFEVADRAGHVLQQGQARKLGAVVDAPEADESVITRVHSPRYIDFLRGAWDEWVAMDPANAATAAIPSTWPVRTFRTDVVLDNFSARLGLYSYDAGTPLTSGTWAAVRMGAFAAVVAAKAVLAGERAAFALTRPPCQHAGAGFFGGYCFLNNA